MWTIDSTRAGAFWGRGRAGPAGRAALSAGPAAALLLVAQISSVGLTDLVLPFVISFAAIAPWVFALKPRPLAFLAGATVVPVLALLIELEAQSAMGLLLGPTVVLLLVAPVTEELLKFGVAVPTGATYQTAAGAALGFAASENGIYYLAAWGGSTTTLLTLVVIRSITDPLVHTAATTLTVSSWRGPAAAFPAGILLHASWNALTLVLAEAPEGVALPLFGLAVVGLFVVLYLEHRWRATRRALVDRRTRSPVWEAFGA
ncbi:MAG: PrsW family glutamic-type intramembrane protease [Thermoplasmata archaeon]|nr:PrsW family glutamic-type intramembrane protease [Thermoplasmata archaeon]